MSSIRPRRVDIREVLEASIALVESRIRASAKLQVRLALLPPIEGDASALGQVLVAALQDAASAVELGGSGDHAISVVAQRFGPNAILIEIADSGARHVTEVRRESRRVVMSHGGAINLERGGGAGSRVRVVLPAIPRATVGAHEGPQLRGLIHAFARGE